jgi:hypothetical protein
MFQIPERKEIYVIPGVDYMEVIGRATQEAKAETGNQRLHGCRRYDYTDVIGTTPWKEKVELCREQQPRVEYGTETESDSGRI